MRGGRLQSGVQSSEFIRVYNSKPTKLALYTPCLATPPRSFTLQQGVVSNTPQLGPQLRYQAVHTRTLLKAPGLCVFAFPDSRDAETTRQRRTTSEASTPHGGHRTRLWHATAPAPLRREEPSQLSRAASCSEGRGAHSGSKPTGRRGTLAPRHRLYTASTLLASLRSLARCSP